MKPRIGAYILTGDPTWLASSLSRYYDLVDDLVVLVPSDGLSWTGRPLPVEACLAAVRSVDVDSKARMITGRWTDPRMPLSAEIAQRQRGISELQEVDWILQIDNDELLLSSHRFLEALAHAEDAGLTAVEWPMRVLYRHLGGNRFLEVVSLAGEARYEYPGPVAVRPTALLIDCRRTGDAFLRPVVRGDTASTQLDRAPELGEHRMPLLDHSETILHNSWGRSPGSVWRKLRSSAHQSTARLTLYYYFVWWPSPATWRWLRNFHPLYGRLWPRLKPFILPARMLREVDRT